MPIFKSVLDFIKTNMSIKFHDYQTENVAFRAYTRFSKIWPTDLLFDPTWPIFKLVWDLIKTNILTKFHGYRTKNVACRLYTRQKVDDTTHNRYSMITIAHSEHFILKWAKNASKSGFDLNWSFSDRNIPIAKCFAHSSIIACLTEVQQTFINKCTTDFHKHIISLSYIRIKSWHILRIWQVHWIIFYLNVL